ncbi:MAG: hypothetical protein AB7V11_18465 [Pyrinomonadaceae bacterium]
MYTLTDIFSKFHLGAAACAVAGAAVLMPGAVAQASPAAPLPTVGLGASLDVCEEAEADDCLSPFAAASASGTANAVGEGPFQNNFIWIGELPDPLPDNIAVFEYNAIPLLPQAWQDAAYAWWEEVLPNGFQACLLGLTYQLNSYSTMTVGLTRGCTG